MDSPRNRLGLGIAAVAIVLGLCIGAVWFVRGRLPAQPAPVAAAPASDASLRAENLRLRAEVARLTAERDTALLQKAPPIPAQATPVPAPAFAAPVPAQPATRVRHVEKSATPASGGFTEPQTFSSASTSN